MPTNIADFNIKLMLEGKQLIESQLVLFLRRIILIVIRRVTLRTPVDTGNARGGWFASNEIPAEAPPARNDRSGREVIREAVGTLAAVRAFGVWWFSNNRPHINVLEEGGFEPPDPGPSKDPRPDRLGRILVRGGYSVQAPRGMVSVTLAEIESGFSNGGGIAA